MGKKFKRIPTNLITGFLGSGKTTAILNLLSSKPANTNWAVLVNEFGEVGIDGALLQQQGTESRIFVKEVPGGCICCAAGLPLQIAINLLLKQADPERLLIEPTGAGHPKKVMQMLTGQFYKEVLDVRASICLVDPRKLEDEQINSNQSFLDQMNIADVLLANKSDQASMSELQHFDRYARSFALPKAHIETIEFGRFSTQLLDLGRNTEREVNFPQAHPATANEASIVEPHCHVANTEPDSLSVVDSEQTSWQRFENNGNDYYACGWIFKSHILFEESRLQQWFNLEGLSRMKGLFHTNNGWRELNRVDSHVSSRPMDYTRDSRVEIIEPQAQDWNNIEKLLLECIKTL